MGFSTTPYLSLISKIKAEITEKAPLYGAFWDIDFVLELNV